MKSQKICIIGDGLTGLASALILSQLDIEIHLFSKKNKKEDFQDNRTTVLSNSNLRFLSRCFNKKELKKFWNCNEIELFKERSKKYYKFMHFKKNKKDILHIIQNFELKKLLHDNIKKKKNIKIYNKVVKNFDIQKNRIFISQKSYTYDLILLCVGKNSHFTSNLFNKRFIEKNLDEIAFTSIAKHNSNIITPKQYFLKEGPLAILPINKNSFSFVWSVSSFYKKFPLKKNEKLIKEKLEEILKLKNKIYLNKLKYFPISFKFNTAFSKKNCLALGEGSYNILPIAGQGFNLILRDIKKLYEEIKIYLELGLQIKDSFILSKFSKSRKPENLLFGLGVDLTHKFFKHNKYTENIKNIILKDLDKFKFLKDISLKISDRGIFQ